MKVSIKYNDSRKSLMLIHMLDIHAGPIYSIEFFVSRLSISIYGQLIHKAGDNVVALQCERQTSHTT